MQAQISLCAKIGYICYCEYTHLLKKCTEHTCMSAIYYEQSSKIKADKCKTIVTFEPLPKSKILDTVNILILSNLQKPWTVVCKDVDRTFDLEYSTYRILNRSELCECSLMAGNYLLSQATSNCGGMPEAKDGFFTTHYAFNRIVLDVLMEKFNIQVDEDTVTEQSLFLIRYGLLFVLSFVCCCCFCLYFWLWWLWHELCWGILQECTLRPYRVLCSIAVKYI